MSFWQVKRVQNLDWDPGCTTFTKDDGKGTSLFKQAFTNAWIIKRLGTGLVTVCSVSLTAAALLGFSQSQSVIWLMVLAVPLGLGAGAVDATLNNYVATHYKAKHLNWLHCFWDVGAMLGPIVLSYTLAAGPRDINYVKSKYLEIENMGVIPEYRSQGIGLQLIQKCLAWAKNKEYQKV